MCILMFVYDGNADNAYFNRCITLNINNMITHDYQMIPSCNIIPEFIPSQTWS